mmetsp:Transcript_8803/g.21415  ORF Transcript_8803/g.21415 Transcript_8803/m.21415 type:complete len:241 (-) Transcript_8803:51-773(-)
MITCAPLRWSIARALFRSSYILRAFSRSISIMVSNCASSSSRSWWMYLFSCTCASRMVTTFEYIIMAFMCFTSSWASSILSLAFWSRPFVLACSSFSKSLICIAIFIFRSSSIRIIFSFLALLFASFSALAASLIFLLAISSALVKIFVASLIRFRSEAAMIDATTPASAAAASACLGWPFFFWTVSLPTIMSPEMSLDVDFDFFVPNSVSSTCALCVRGPPGAVSARPGISFPQIEFRS